MAICLVKGQRVDFEKGLTHLTIEMGWKINKDANPIYYLDASTFLLGRSGQIENENDFVFYNSNKRVPVLDNNGNVLIIETNPDAVIRKIKVVDRNLNNLLFVGRINLSK